jgi:hypothetical protein
VRGGAFYQWRGIKEGGQSLIPFSKVGIDTNELTRKIKLVKNLKKNKKI